MAPCEGCGNCGGDAALEMDNVQTFAKFYDDKLSAIQVKGLPAEQMYAAVMWKPDGGFKRYEPQVQEFYDRVRTHFTEPLFEVPPSMVVFFTDRRKVVDGSMGGIELPVYDAHGELNFAAAKAFDYSGLVFRTLHAHMFMSDKTGLVEITTHLPVTEELSSLIAATRQIDRKGLDDFLRDVYSFKPE